jgi:hypothetical protein
VLTGSERLRAQSCRSTAQLNQSCRSVRKRCSVKRKRWPSARERVISRRECPSSRLLHPSGQRESYGDRGGETYNRDLREGLPQLLQCPLCCGMFGYVEVNEPSRADLECDKYIEDTEACCYGNKEVAGYDAVGMIVEMGGPSLTLDPPGQGGCLTYLPTVRGESRIWSFSSSSSAIRSSPQVGFSAAIRRIKCLSSADTCGLPTGLDFQRQNRRKAARCQLISVAGLTITKAFRQSKK